MKISISILTWNCFDVVDDTLHNLKNDLKDIDHEIIIVDNGSTDGCQDLATIKNDMNLGISKGKNQGIDNSRGEFILLLDGDILYVPNSIKCFIYWLEQNHNEYAIGFYPNKFTRQKNTIIEKQHEDYCYNLFEPKIHTMVCLFYGMFRRKMFEQGIRCCEEGVFGLPGYGWEDRDLYMQMQKAGINQWVAGINTAIGKYYHKINSSIKLMGDDEYIRTSKERADFFKQRWPK